MSLNKIKTIVSNALKRTRQKVKRLEEALGHKEKEIRDLREKIDRLQKENEKLKDELKAAHKPPPWAKPNKSRAENAKPKNKKGPKVGHKPNKRQKPPEPHQQVDITPLACPGCDHKLPRPTKWHEHTQIDIPMIADPIVTIFKIGWSWCVFCNKYVSVNDKLANTLYGPRLHAYAAYLKFKLGATLGKIKSLIQDQYGLAISTGALSQMIARTARGLEGEWENLKTALLDQRYLHADETGWRIDGDNGWLWSFANQDLSFYTIEDSRGQKVVEKVLGKSYGGTLISDFYSAYNAIDCEKQKCWPHLLREVHDLTERYPNNGEISAYLNRLRYLFERGKHLQLNFKAGVNIDKPLARLKGDTQRWAERRHGHPDLKRLSRRLLKYRRELYTFIKAGTDPTNNFAEREVRPAVLMRKTSYGNRSDAGARTQAILMSVIRTAEKRGQNFVEQTAKHLDALH